MSTRSLLSSLMAFKCPRCRRGDLFFKPWRINTAYKMPEGCSHCKLSYLPEPGFWYGSMFLGYIVTAFIFLGAALVLVFVLQMQVYSAFLILIAFAVLTHNFFFRFSRSFYFHLVMKYDESYEVDKDE